MGKRKCAYRALVGKPEGKSPLAGPRRVDVSIILSGS
jgi:hypothetical protein